MQDGRDEPLRFPVTCLPAPESAEGMWLKEACSGLAGGACVQVLVLLSSPRTWALSPWVTGGSPVPGSYSRPMKYLGMNSTFTISNYFLCLLTCVSYVSPHSHTKWQPHGESLLSVLPLYCTRGWSRAPGTLEILSTCLADEMMNKLIVWSPTKPFLFWDPLENEGWTGAGSS